ncbi:MAG: 5'-methylthioadenosine/adenosylhomocysteine nucleosidase [Ruminococcaceae bacterium]|nr:5'-methylthioadenosine/adenosylhomocysteine nucleosidase [Oscillospiraceae bacterium]
MTASPNFLWRLTTMKTTLKKALSLVLALTLALSCMATLAMALDTATLSATAISVDGEAVDATVYTIDGAQYVKLRDIAAALDDTDARFNIDYDAAERAVILTPGMDYAAVGGELTAAGAETAAYIVSADKFYRVNEKIDIALYKIAGNNYVALADFAAYIDATVEGTNIVTKEAAPEVPVYDEETALGIISAMTSELRALVEAADIAKETVIGGNTYYEGTLNGVKVVMVKGGVGKTLAASCTQTLINVFDVGGIVFTGIAGGVGDETKVMDMVIATELVQHDYGDETNDGFIWEGSAGIDKETGMIPVDETLSAMAYESAVEILGEDNVHQGVIATGDQFIASESYVAELQEKFNALACEMEGAAVARIAAQYNVPCAVLRCMSDKADGLAHDSIAFNGAKAADTSANVLMDMLSTIAETQLDLVEDSAEVIGDTTPRTAIISAMSSELKALVEAADIEKEVVLGDCTFYLGNLNGEDVVMVKAGVGKVLAASGTAALINNFNVKSVIFTGIAGGVGDETKVMDMVIGTGLVIHDYGDETNDGFIWEGSAGVDTETGLIPVDEELSAIAYASAVEILGEENVHQGVIATGDQFIASESYVAELQEKFDALACEMEGASVARVCAQYGVDCAVIRCMSDKADGLAHDSIAFNGGAAADTSASVIIDMMAEIAA